MILPVLALWLSSVFAQVQHIPKCPEHMPDGDITCIMSASGRPGHFDCSGLNNETVRCVFVQDPAQSPDPESTEQRILELEDKVARLEEQVKDLQNLPYFIPTQPWWEPGPNWQQIVTPTYRYWWGPYCSTTSCSGWTLTTTATGTAKILSVTP